MSVLVIVLVLAAAVLRELLRVAVRSKARRAVLFAERVGGTNDGRLGL